MYFLTSRVFSLENLASLIEKGHEKALKITKDCYGKMGFIEMRKVIEYGSRAGRRGLLIAPFIH